MLDVAEAVLACEQVLQDLNFGAMCTDVRRENEGGEEPFVVCKGQAGDVLVVTVTLPGSEQVSQGTLSCEVLNLASRRTL